ncbi:aminotransferase class III-fold pyridoxal phosphate-dependent enzyme [bacterium]|nr:aminotransferase class III-fold pyridoxal phosphate-dependent enzyme [bacterium]
MPERDYSALIAKLQREYRAYASRSEAFQQRASQVLVDGGSHALRLIEPFPPRIRAARGAYVEDLDGHQILDFWQGHYANILGHNPPGITEVLVESFAGGFGLQTGFADMVQAELAEMICRQTNMDQVRFTTSGTLSTMYAILMARAFTGRELVLKVGGGWHGAHMWGLKGVGHKHGFQHVDSRGIPQQVAQDVVITEFNHIGKLEEVFKVNGECMACFILEPVIGAGGMIPASQAYLQRARELCDQYGVVLIFDEVVSGFRYRAGDVGTLFGVRPDLMTLGKIIGGGMPVAAVAGRKEIMGLVSRAQKSKVKFSGGTYSAHPASMLAAKTMVAYLIAHEDEVYPRLFQMSALLREKVLTVFAQSGVPARFSGVEGSILPQNTLHMLVLPYDPEISLDSPDVVLDPQVCDVTFTEKVLKLAMLLEDVHIVHGLGAMSTAHGEAEIERVSEAYRRALNKIKILQTD